MVLLSRASIPLLSGIRSVWKSMRNWVSNSGRRSVQGRELSHGMDLVWESSSLLEGEDGDLRLLDRAGVLCRCGLCAVDIESSV